MNNGQVRLSFSTINNCLQPNNSHNWINKMMKIPVEVKPAMTAGRLGHDLIQKHVSGKELIKGLDYIKITFPIVEEKDFDERCKFSFEVKGYEIIGFYDGLDRENGNMLEIKLSSNPWSVGKFKKAVQRKIYSLANPDLKKAYLITGSTNPEVWVKNPEREWEYQPLKIYSLALTEKDRQDALKWIEAGIQLFENGDFSGGLDENDRCTDPWCPWGKNCSFKQF